ncbi:MAG: hypothetical protein WCG08_12565 [Paludibacter sp.]
MNTKNYFLTLILGLSLFSWTAKADVTKTVGATGADFATLGAAFTDINTTNPGSYSGVVNLQIIDNTTEAVAASLSAVSGNWTSLNIYPTVTGKTISGAIDGSLIFLSGVNQLVIDGRLHNASGAVTGSTRDLTITNSFVSANANTIRFNGGSSNNTVKYCTISGSSTTNGMATIFFGAGATTVGNSNNTVSYNKITNAGGNRPQMSIFSFGVTSQNNDNNTISNNEFADCMSPTTYSTILRIYNFSTNWTVSGNSFYETTTFAPIDSYACTIIAAAGTPCTGHTISGNFIGGSAANCSGTLTKTADNDNAFTAIFISVGISPITTVNNNTIKNINWSDPGYARADCACISFTGAGNINGNTIGASTGTGSITVTTPVAGNWFQTIALTASTGGTLTADNNTIGSITAKDGSPNLFSFYTNGTGTTNITNNNMGSTTTANSIYTDAINASGLTYGNIRVNSTGINNVTGNTICNISNGSGTGSGVLYGILVQAGTNTVSANFISKLTAPNSGAVSNYVKIYGINITGSAASVASNYYNNIITMNENKLLQYYGICEANTLSTATTNIFFNTIYIGGSETGYSQSFCINSANTGTYIKNIQNNILVNTRSTAGTATWVANYALFATTGRTTTGASFTCDYNDYYSSGTATKLGNYAATDITALPIVTGKTGNDANSKNVDPLFANTAGLSAADYKTNATISLPGTAIAGITTDYSTITRGGTPRMGAFEAGFYTQLNAVEAATSPRIISNSVGIAVPLTGESNIELYTINGLLIEKTRANGMYTRTLANGMYIICIDGKASKFIK